MYNPEDAADEAAINLPAGLLIAGRWKILKKLGEGGCGSVYKVLDIKNRSPAALKAEPNAADGGVLKLEVKILKRLAGRRHIANLLQAGKRTTFSYMVTKLLGPSLERLTLRSGKTSSVSTQIRVGMQCLFGLKQLHEIGFVHRDVKPGNLAIGCEGAEVRILHLLDFGLSREYVIRSKNVIKMREARCDVLFRGTPHYASISALQGEEQGRADDLWSMLYIMAELRDRLPWMGLGTIEDILNLKLDTYDNELFFHSPPKLIEIAVHLRKLNYRSRPNYFLIYDILNNIMKTSHSSHNDPFDWELEENKGERKSVRVIEPKTIMPPSPSIGTIDYSCDSQSTLRSASSIECEVVFVDPTLSASSSTKGKTPSPKSPKKDAVLKSPKSPKKRRRSATSPLSSATPTPPRKAPPLAVKLFAAEDFKKNEIGF